MHSRRVLLPLAVLLLALHAIPAAQPVDRLEALNARIDRIFGSSDFQVPRFCHDPSTLPF
jgi:hypothetical protein